MIISVNRRGGGRWGQCEAVNDRQCELKGQSSEAIKGVNQAQPSPPRRGGCHPVLSSAIQCNHAQSRTIKRNQAHRGEEVDDEGPDLTRVGHVKEDLGHRGEGLRVL